MARIQPIFKKRNGKSRRGQKVMWGEAISSIAQQVSALFPMNTMALCARTSSRAFHSHTISIGKTFNLLQSRNRTAVRQPLGAVRFKICEENHVL
jgi:hypothetical protein